MKIDAAWVISDRARECLQRCDLFQDLNTNQLKEIAALVEEHSLEPDELLLREGEEARYLFVIVEGRGIAQLKMHRGWLGLGLVGPGDAAGWSSIVGAQAYPASIIALKSMQVARIESRGLALLMGLDPSFGYAVNRRLSSVFWGQYQAALESFRYDG